MVGIGRASAQSARSDVGFEGDRPHRPITDLDLFRLGWAILRLMKKCPVCGRDVISKRKDAVFCKDSACRKKAHEVRKEQTAMLPPATHGNKASVVVTFPDGGRWLLELSPLHLTAPGQLPTLAQVVSETQEIRSGSVPTVPVVFMPTATEPHSTLGPSGIGSEQISHEVSASAPARIEPPPAACAPVSTNTTPEPARPGELRTIELFFTNESDRRLLFHEAVRRRIGGGWAVRSFARAHLGFGWRDAYGLGGVPGRWRDFYPSQSPTEFGLDADLGVLYADDNDGRAYAADSELLKQALGADWRARLDDAAKERTPQRS